jgi:uncharacterized membrane protein
MSGILVDWVEIFVRWLHVIAGIAWIGSSFYFVHLDLSLKQRPGLPERAYGEAWQVHGGGFYHMVKYLVAPARMPDELTWFKWEAYATWLSGMALLVLVYYLAAELYMIEPAVSALSPGQAVLLSIGGLVAGWVLYDLMCRSPLGRNDLGLSIAGFMLLMLFAWGYSQLFSGRGAFMQMGALIGTIMVANVLMVIIPGQRKVVADLIAGRTPDPRHGQRGKQRSVHNNYLTLPVVFVMIGTHYPLAFATRWSWLMLGLVIVMSVLIRHFYNTRHKGLPSPWWTWIVVALCGAAIVGLSSGGPSYGPTVEARPGLVVVEGEAEQTVIGRCSMCHAPQPVWEGIPHAPKGVLLDTPQRVQLEARRIASNAVWTKAMPPGNITGMTDDERALLATWLAAQGVVR